MIRYSLAGNNEAVIVRGEKQGKMFVYVEDIGYDAWGQRVWLKLGNEVETRYEYDEERRWLQGIRTESRGGYAAEVLQNITYGFDLVGNVTGYENVAGNYRTRQGYEYDGLYQLTGVSGESAGLRYGMTEYTAKYR
jgi:hypothetical protein